MESARTIWFQQQFLNVDREGRGVERDNDLLSVTLTPNRQSFSRSLGVATRAGIQRTPAQRWVLVCHV